MTIGWLLAALHLLALGMGLGAVWARGRAMLGELDATGLRRVSNADTWWGVAAIVWISTGAVRTFSGFDKGTFYYLHNYLFWTKMGFLAAILILELRPMMTLIQWRRSVARGLQPDTRAARRFAQIQADQERLDVLINNAGIGAGWLQARRERSRGGHELRFAVNYLAPYLLTHLLLPLLRRSAPARIVNVASAGQQPIDFDNLMLEDRYDGLRAYRQSKLGQGAQTSFQGDS